MCWRYLSGKCLCKTWNNHNDGRILGYWYWYRWTNIDIYSVILVVWKYSTRMGPALFHCNVFRWLGAYLDWSLTSISNIKSIFNIFISNSTLWYMVHGPPRIGPDRYFISLYRWTPEKRELIELVSGIHSQYSTCIYIDKAKTSITHHSRLPVNFEKK